MAAPHINLMGEMVVSVSAPAIAEVSLIHVVESGMIYLN